MACPNPAAKTFFDVGELNHTVALKAVPSPVRFRVGRVVIR